MSRHHAVSAAGLALGLALWTVSVMAQTVTVESDDAAYCKKLASLQSRYSGSANTSASLQTVTAQNICTNERAAEAIPQLEQRLRANGFNLPERAIGTRRQ